MCWVFLYSTVFRLILLPTQPPMQWAIFSGGGGVKRPEREANNLLPVQRLRNLDIFLHSIYVFIPDRSVLGEYEYSGSLHRAPKH
jgi:hypothetical protein